MSLGKLGIVIISCVPGVTFSTPGTMPVYEDITNPNFTSSSHYPSSGSKKVKTVIFESQGGLKKFPLCPWAYIMPQHPKNQIKNLLTKKWTAQAKSERAKTIKRQRENIIQKNRRFTWIIHSITKIKTRIRLSPWKVTFDRLSMMSDDDVVVIFRFTKAAGLETILFDGFNLTIGVETIFVFPLSISLFGGTILFIGLSKNFGVDTVIFVRLSVSLSGGRVLFIRSNKAFGVGMIVFHRLIRTLIVGMILCRPPGKALNRKTVLPVGLNMTLGDGIILFHRLRNTLGAGLVVSIRFNMTVNVGKVTFGKVGKSREMKVY